MDTNLIIGIVAAVVIVVLLIVWGVVRGKSRKNEVVAGRRKPQHRRARRVVRVKNPRRSPQQLQAAFCSRNRGRNRLPSK